MRLRFALLLVACGGRTDLGGGHASQTEDASQPQLQGVVVNDCAPNDGLAIAFALAFPGATVVPSCANSVVGEGSVRISFWGPPPSAPGTYAVGDGTFPSGSLAAYCPTGGTTQCVAATHGSFTLTEFTKTAASGSFSLVLPDQTIVTGSFSHIPLCNNSIMCG